ncbi:MAG: peptide chain release factor 1 [Actinomycetota bacterium]|nr:MAG: peptide chain release factor 1 [Acidimicrobium sp. BACL19 MAG-120924-bin39]MDA2956494.1 peptide chain release factor 1 [Actinomycetota bacterium]MDP4642732.1 peptide chain release factor 1 [Ilumatobacteraceae bacterium]MDP4835106.1 peptide chain release factor 1 [Ilumatobacteraceae bacterium]
MLAKLDAILADFEQVETSLTTSEVLGDQYKLRDVSRRYKQMGPLVECIREYKSVLGNVEAAKELIESASVDERESLDTEMRQGLVRLQALEDELKVLLIPPDPNDGKNVILEIRGAEGGEEANLFAGELVEMYRAWATRNGWSFEMLAYDRSPMGGVNQATALLKGETVWRQLRFEGGPHRVQRVPVTENAGRIHTSSATVAVMPEAEEIDLAIDERDLEIDVYRSGGSGGQSVNTTDSAVRITHKPTGLVVTMQDERSQLQNRVKAMQVLRTRLLQRRQDEHEAKISADRRAQVGKGGRGEKIRTYNYKENRVTDHRIGFTLYQLQDVLAGNLDPVIDALTLEYQAEQLAKQVGSE